MAQFVIMAETDLRGASQGGKYAYLGPLEEDEARRHFLDIQAGRPHELVADRKNGVRTLEAPNRVSVLSRSSLTRGVVLDRYTLSEVL
ncbi:MAG: hypothetical protein LBE25_12535 [Arthrobacter sp.]|nr:hypothetical protein [Arthrobacter sp.]